MKNRVCFPDENSQKGSAMLMATLLFIFISLSIIFGFVSFPVREFKNTNLSFNSKGSYFLAESGVEDVIYRIIKNLPVSASETITLNSDSVTTTITDDGPGQKTISSVSDVANHNRKVDLSLNAGEGLSFNYGVQVGSGGIYVGVSSFVDGSIYSDGPVTGLLNSVVSGSVTSANGSSLVADQQNGSGTPAYNFVFGRVASSADIAQSFIAGSTGPLNKVEFYLKKTSTPSNLVVYLTHDNNNRPDKNNVLTSGTLLASLVSSSYGWVTVSFNPNSNIISGTKYWLVLDGTNNDTKYYTIGANTSYANGGALIGNYYGETWNSTSPSNADLFFKVYLQGLTGLVGSLTVGSNGVGNVYAHTVTNSTIAGTNYCQTGSGNNKTCDTSLPDPVSLAMPISEQNIQDWKDDALTGGIINGNYTPGGSGVTLGPKKIDGDLLLDSGDVLTLTGNLWVTGDFKVDNGAIVQPSASYGASSVAIIVDGIITIKNNAKFNSGNSSSYVLVLTTSNCPFDLSCNGKDAIELSSRIEAAILYAGSGNIDVLSQSKARQLTAYGISLGYDSDLIYDSGLINQNFVGGPLGSWSVQGWGESQ